MCSSCLEMTIDRKTFNKEMICWILGKAKNSFKNFITEELSYFNGK